MASNITIKTTPPSYSPVYNPIEICAYEQDATSRSEDNYKYVITCTTEAGDTDTWYVPLAPSDKLFYGWQDVSRFLEKFISESLLLGLTDSAFVAASVIARYTIDIESGWNVAGVFTVDPDGVGAVSTGNLYFWGGSFEYHNWIDQMNQGTPFNSWINNTTLGSSGQFLTNNPDTRTRLTDYGRINYLTDTPGDVDELLVETYDADGVSISSFVIDNPLGSTPTANRILSIAAGAASLNAVNNTYISTGAQPIVTSDVASYTIQVNNTISGAMSEVLTITLEEDCRYEAYRLHFLNKLGGFDFFNFRSRNELKSTTNRKTYTRSETIIETAGISYSNQDNGKADYYVENRDKYKLRSDYITASQYTWLKELINSPLVFMEYENTARATDYKQVYVTTSSWDEKKTDIDKLIKFELDVEAAHMNQRQRR